MKTEVKKKLIVLINSKVSNIKTKSAQKTERKPEQQKTLYHLNHSVLLQSSLNQF